MEKKGEVEEKNVVLASKIAKVVAAANGVVKQKLNEKRGRKMALRNITLHKVMITPQVRNAISEMIEASDLGANAKELLASSFGNARQRKRILNSMLGYEKSTVYNLFEKTMSQEDINKFLALLRQIYIRLSPLAIVKQAEIMLSSKTPVEVALKAAQDLQNRAGLGTNQGASSNNLPVSVVIKVPKTEEKAQINTQVNILPSNQNGNDNPSSSSGS